MANERDGSNDFTRRQALSLSGAGLLATAPSLSSVRASKDTSMQVTCFIRYQIDPFQRDAFELYASNWGKIIPRCGGFLVGYFMPHEGTNDVAWGIIGFESLAAYEAYRARLRTDPESRANFAFAADRKFVLREERSFLSGVDGTTGLPPKR